MSGSRPGSVRSWPSRVPTPRESERESEFLKYFQPLRELTPEGPKFVDVRDPWARSQHVPIPCPDKTLTALCQLGALRIGSRRAMIFMFETNAAHILAESTRTLSLETNDIYVPGDQPWMGYSIIPREIACCEITVNLPAFSQSEPDDSKSVLAIDDLTKDDRTDYLAYVKEFPDARSYYGVPITTPAGINIGAYCILDDKPRNGLSHTQNQFLQEMAKTVMDHLISIRAQAENLRSIQMVNGLGAFVQGSSSSRDWRRRLAKRKICAAPHSTASQTFSHPAAHRSIPETSQEVRKPHGTDLDIATSAVQNLYLESSAEHAPRPTKHVESISELPEPSTRAVRAVESQDDFAADRKGMKRRGVPLELEPDLPPSDAETFQRAAVLMREALSLDGVAFFDAAVGISESLSDTASTATSDESSTEDSQGSEFDPVTASGSESASGKATSSTSPCRVLGHSVPAGKNSGPTPTDIASASLTEQSLRNLLRRYPYGKIWSFDERGVLYAQDVSHLDNLDFSKHKHRKRRHRHPNGDGASSSSEIHDSEMIQKAFPGARCVALHGLWDTTRHRWSAACLLWSYNNLRHMDVNTDLNFVAAFSDVVLADTKRLQSEFADRAKSTFMSSVSHELRSPLHGILGSAEVLHEFSMDTGASALVHQIETCGQNLRDIIDHILDFAKLREQKLKRNTVKSSRIGRTVSANNVNDGAGNELAALDVDVDLADLTEELVESTVYSHYCSKVFQNRPRITTIIDIDRDKDMDWRCRLAKGGWKRVVMNLVINALKYSHEGYVHVSLQQQSVPGSRRKFDAVLTVKDTGQGMSADFLENHYFRAFVQQDVHTDGMGLGMSMVRRIIHAMGAQIDVRSDQCGGGTCVTVTIPLERNGESGVQCDVEKPSLQGSLAGLKVGIIENNSAAQLGKLELESSGHALTSVGKTCRYLGLEDYHVAWDGLEHTAVNVCPEAEYANYIRSQRRRSSGQDHVASGRRLVVICKDSSSECQLKEWTRTENLSSCIVEHVALPCGARSLHAAIASVLAKTEQLNAPVLINEAPGAHTGAGALPELQGTQVSGAAEAITQALERDVKHSDQGRVGSPVTGPVPPGPSLSQARSEFPFTPIKQLPAAHRDESSPSAESPRLTRTLSRPDTPTQSLEPPMLLVDDNPINLRLLVTYAEKRNIAYTTATDGRQAVEAFQTAYRHSRARSSKDLSAPTTPLTTPLNIELSAAVPQIILMDINMPVMDGYEATRRIRVYESKHRIKPAKIVALTALGSKEAADAAFGSGVDDFLTKPVQFRHLTRFLQELRERE